MSNSNPNDTKLEQQRSDAATAALKGQVEGSHNKDTEAAAEGIAENSEDNKDKD